jgi:hypothetical protein
MSIRLNGSTSGYTEIDAPAVAGSNTLVLPTGNGSADQALVTNGSGTLSFADRGRMTLATAQNSTSGTAIDFTGIPSWVKRVTLMLSGVSTNGTSQVLFQLGTSSGVETTSYQGGAGYSGYSTANSSGFLYADTSSANASYLRYGAYTITLMGSNTWVFTGTSYAAVSGVVMFMSAGSKALSGTLDRVRITTVNGTDTFDAGSINILYEG